MREYALTSRATRNPSLLVSMKAPPRSSLFAKAMLCATTSSRPSSPPMRSYAAATFSSWLTSHSTRSVSPQGSTSLATVLRTRSFWYAMASFAPASWRMLAIAQAMLLWLATPNTTPVLSFRSMGYIEFSLFELVAPGPGRQTYIRL